MFKRTLFGSVLVSMMLALPAVADAKEYLVSNGDKLSIAIFQWPQYSGESRVDDFGTISLPLLGIRRLPVKGLGLAQIEQNIMDRISSRIESRGVVVIVDVAEYRPISVLGAVNTPGRFGFTSGTTVLHALAMAGGVVTAPSLGDPFRRFVDLTQGQERSEVLKLELWGAIARRARLRAEREGLDRIEFPKELLAHESRAGTRSATESQTKIFETNKRQLANEIGTLNRQIQILKNQIDVLETHRKEVRRAVKKLEERLDRQNALVGKGLARRLTIMTVDAQLVDMRGEYRRTSVSIMRSRSELSTHEKSILTIKNRNAREIETGLVALETEINIIKQRIRSQNSILASHLGAHTVPGATSEDQTVLAFSIVRNTGDVGEQQFDARETTSLMPGDVLLVRFTDATATSVGPDGPMAPSATRSPNCKVQNSGNDGATECPPDALNKRLPGRPGGSSIEVSDAR